MTMAYSWQKAVGKQIVCLNPHKTVGEKYLGGVLFHVRFGREYTNVASEYAYLPTIQ